MEKKNILTLVLLIFTCWQINAQAGRTANADGRTDTYQLIESFGYGVEVPDCKHPIKHITQQYDNDLKKQVFVFTLHAELDDDRCGAQDRQRTEIKTFGTSPESMKGYRGRTQQYRWKFKLDKEFQPSPNFFHIHQVKADAGPNAGAPIVTLTPRLKGNKQVLQFNVVSPQNVSTILAEEDLALFKGTWVEVTETIFHDNPGIIVMEIKRVSDGKRLLYGKSNKIDLWRDGARFNRPKYGIYRSLKERSYLRDESVLFADIEFIELTENKTLSQNMNEGWESVSIIESHLLSSLPQRIFNVINFGAFGNNTEDCSKAFNQALIKCNEMGGGTVFVPKGMYKLNGPLYVLSNTHLQLSEDAILSFSPQMKSDFLLNLDSQENIKITGPGKIRGTGKGAIHLLNSRNVMIVDCDIESSGDNITIEASNNSENIILRNNYFRKSGQNAITLGGNMPGVVRNIFAEQNTFGIIPKHIVYIYGTDKGGIVEEVRMRNNRSEGYPCETAFHFEQKVYDSSKNSRTPILWYGYFENFSNLNVTEKGISFISLPKTTHPIESMWFDNIQIIGAKEIIDRHTTRDIYVNNVSPKPIDLYEITQTAVQDAYLPYAPVPEFWSVAAAQSTMARYPDFTKAYWNAWTYVNSYMACAFERLYKATGDDVYLKYIKNYIDNFIDKDGNFMAAISYKGLSRIPNVCDNLDNMMPGNTLVMLYEYYKDPRYKKAADYIFNCIKDYPRNSDGGFWHAKSLHGQMWIDGVFMGQMFLLRYGRSIGNQEYAYNEAVKQITAYAKRAEQNSSGLYVHGVYEPGHGDRLCQWADPITGKSSEVWGEGLGWYALILVEALETLPKDHEGYNAVKDIFIRLAVALKRTQDVKTGGWFQVVDKGDESDNWIETSGSAMFTYALKLGINLGVLNEAEYGIVVKNGYTSIVNHAKINERGLVDVYEACDGVGVQENYGKYINYKKSLNAKEAYVGFVWATEIVERDAIKKILNEKSTIRKISFGCTYCISDNSEL